MQNSKLYGQDDKELKPLQDELIKVLRKNGPLNRNQIVEELNRPRTTIYDNLSILVHNNMVKKFSRQVKSRGRPIVFFKLKEE